MRPRRLPIPLALVLLIAGCSDDIRPNPVVGPQPPAPAPRFLQWAGGAAPRFIATGAASGPVASGGLSDSSGGLSLNQYVATFWSVRGQQRSVQINYLSSSGDTSSPFLRLTTVDPTYVPLRGNLAPGDSVLITVTIDPHTIKVSLEPSGLLFGDPGQLRISYGGAGGDLNGDGEVDDADAYIESQLLGMWYREGVNSAWTRISADQSLPDKSFISALLHFSDYAISW